MTEVGDDSVCPVINYCRWTLSELKVKMTSSSQAVNNLKSKMQSVRDQVDKYRDLYEDVSRQHQQEMAQRNQVYVRLVA